MSRISEDQLSQWTKPAFGNEDEKAENTERAIREAIRSHATLKALPISVYAKGSYKNNTNVRRDSDVDVAVEYTGIVYPEYGPDTDQSDVRRTLGTGPYTGPFRNPAGRTQIGMFKDAVGEALENAFGPTSVVRHNKVFTVRESSRSLAADVVPCATHRKYWGPRRYYDGIRLLPDRPPRHRIVNYPQQHYDNGVEKNERTKRRFKSIVRILKNLENQMCRDGHPEVASYLIESLVYNAPNSCFLTPDTWGARVRAVLVHAWDDTEQVESEKRWFEVNGIKYLFHDRQKWDRQGARDFVHASWQYVKP